MLTAKAITSVRVYCTCAKIFFIFLPPCLPLYLLKYTRCKNVLRNYFSLLQLLNFAIIDDKSKKTAIYIGIFSYNDLFSEVYADKKKFNP